MNNIIDLDKNDVFKCIANYYWEHLTPSIDGSIWQWLEREYSAKRTFFSDPQEGPFRINANSLQLKFSDPESQTLFVLRWL